MFYEALYLELGKLFYYLASVDGKVQNTEKESLQKMIQHSWKPLENSVDKYGTDLANLIDFSFDYEESEKVTKNGMESFEAFFNDNKLSFTPAIASNILQTAKTIAEAYHGKNKGEEKVLKRLNELFQK